MSAHAAHEKVRRIGHGKCGRSRGRTIGDRSHRSPQPTAQAPAQGLVAVCKMGESEEHGFIWWTFINQHLLLARVFQRSPSKGQPALIPGAGDAPLRREHALGKLFLELCDQAGLAQQALGIVAF